MAILHKQRQKVTALQVIARSEQDLEPPWRFKRIDVIYRFSGVSLREDFIRRAIELSERKYCSIYATLQPGVEIHSEYEIIEDATFVSEPGAAD
jgi:putative redox protein